MTLLSIWLSIPDYQDKYVKHDTNNDSNLLKGDITILYSIIH